MSLHLVTEDDTRVIVTRRFAAPPAAVFRAHVEPDLLRQWCSGPDGWQMTECLSDPRPGGEIHYRWANAEGAGFHLSGAFLEVEPDRRTLHVERMHLPDPTPDNQVETLFLAEGDGTLLRMTMTLPDGETRDAMLATGMADGMEDSYRRLDGLL